MPDLKWPLNPKLKCSQSSQLLVDFLMSTRMLQLVDQPTRIRRNQQPSTLDLVMISDANLLANLEYLDPIGKSDHVLIKADMQLCFTPRKRTITFSRLVTNYEDINTRLSNIDWSFISTHTDVSSSWDAFKLRLQEIIDSCSSRVTVKKSSTKPWIDGKILKLINKKRSLWRTYKRTSSKFDYATHRAFSNRLSDY